MQFFFIPSGYLADGLAGPSEASEPSEQVVTLDVLACQFGQEHVHLVVQCGVVSGCSDDESAVTEHVADDVRVVSLRDVVHHNVLHAGLRCRASDDFSGALGVAVHGSVADDEPRFRFVAAHAVVHVHHLADELVPDGAVCGADVVELHACQLLQCVLNGRAILANDV